MIEKISKKQPNSKKCFVCGMENSIGLKSSFYELKSGGLVGIFHPADEHQGYPGRLHGGIAGTLLDETLARVIMVKEENIWGVTLDLSLKYRKPIPLEGEIKVVAKITNNYSKIYEGTAEIKLSDGQTAVVATGRYIKLPIEKIATAEFLSESWELFLSENEISEIDI